MPLPLVQLPAQKHVDAPIRRRLGRVPMQCVDAPAPLAFWHLASFDAPTVAVVWSLAFAWTVEVNLPLRAPVLLALMAWSAYIGDRLLDARSAFRSGQLDQLRERHYFHWRHRRLFISLATGAVIIGASIILAAMPLRALAPNFLLGAAAFAYFSGVHTRRKLPRLVSKELLVGVIFTVGCAVPAWIALHGRRSPDALVWFLLVTVVYFAALAWLNCRAIAFWESDRSRTARSSNILRVGIALALAGAVLACIALAVHPRLAAMLTAGAASALLLASLDFARNRLTPLALRAAADFVLLTPIAVLVLAHWFS